MGSSCSSIDGVGGGGGGLNNEEIKISVKERTQRFNKMASEIDLAPKNGSSGPERRDNKSKVLFSFKIKTKQKLFILFFFSMNENPYRMAMTMILHLLER